MDVVLDPVLDDLGPLLDVVEQMPVRRLDEGGALVSEQPPDVERGDRVTAAEELERVADN